MELKDLAQEIRSAHWNSAQAGTFWEYAGHQESLEALKAKCQEGTNGAKLFAYGLAFEKETTWNEWFIADPKEVEQMTGISVEARKQQASRWAASYLWVHGHRFKLDHVENTYVLVSLETGVTIRWEEIDALVGGGSGKLRLHSLATAE